MILQLLLFITQVLAKSPESACFELQLSFPSKVSYPGSDRYETERRLYWSLKSRYQQPTCIFHPTFAEDVSKAVHLIASYNVPFAIKCGGNNANTPFSSVQDGILIALSSMNKIEFDGKNAIIGSGNRWIDVVSELESRGLTVLSGRAGEIGVAGFLLGGGLSFQFHQYGLAMDDVLNYEVVLADGSIVNANQRENPELFFSLKGGGNQFGLVTEFTMAVHPIGVVYGGYIIYSGSKFPEILSALFSFGSNQDPKAAIIVSFIISESQEPRESCICSFMYDGAEPGDVFNDFFVIEHVASNLSTRKYSDLVKAMSFLVDLQLNLNTRLFTSEVGNWAVRTATYRPRKILFEQTYKEWFNNAELTRSLGNVTLTLSYQLLPKPVSRRNVSNVISLPDETLVWLELANSWLFEEDESDVLNHLETTLDHIEKYKIEHKEHQGYLPMYVNDAGADQDVISRLRGFQRVKLAKEIYDPERFWDRTGGFKII